MKNYYNKIWALSLMLMSLISFSSCMTDDDRIGEDLYGIWYGDFNMYNSNGEHAIKTELEFITGTWRSDHGDGYQRDYYSRGTISNDFTWEVKNSKLYLTYPKNHSLDCVIVDYKLTYNYFTGCIANPETLENLFYFNLKNLEHYSEDYDYVKAQRADIEYDNEIMSTRGVSMNQPAE